MAQMSRAEFMYQAFKQRGIGGSNFRIIPSNCIVDLASMCQES